MTLDEAKKAALLVQNASNLSGVVRTFADVLSALWEEARRIGKGTDWVNRHPIARAFADKIADLSGRDVLGAPWKELGGP